MNFRLIVINVSRRRERVSGPPAYANVGSATGEGWGHRVALGWDTHWRVKFLWAGKRRVSGSLSVSEDAGSSEGR